MDDLVNRNSRSNNVRIVEQIELLFKRKWDMLSNNNTNWSCFVGFQIWRWLQKSWSGQTRECIEALCICFLFICACVFAWIYMKVICTHICMLFILRLVLCNLKWLKNDILYYYQAVQNWRSEVKLSLWLLKGLYVSCSLLEYLGNTDNLFPIKLMKGKLKIYNDKIFRDVFTKHLHRIFSLRTVIVFLCM